MLYTPSTDNFPALHARCPSTGGSHVSNISLNMPNVSCWSFHVRNIQIHPNSAKLFEVNMHHILVKISEGVIETRGFSPVWWSAQADNDALLTFWQESFQVQELLYYGYSKEVCCWERTGSWLRSLLPHEAVKERLPKLQCAQREPTMVEL